MRRLLLVAGLITVLLAGWNGLGTSGTRSKSVLVKEFIMSPISKGLVNENGRHPSTFVNFKTLASEENRSKHDNFKWKYDKHFVTLYCGETECFLGFQVKEYQEFVSPDSRGFILWTFFDYDMDGEFDSVKRNYYLVMQDSVLMMPEYPHGYINKRWYSVQAEEAEKRFEKELHYWLVLAENLI